MIDWMIIVLILIAFMMLLLAIYLKDFDPYWNILFIVLSAVLWWVIALFSVGGIETPYAAYNSTSGLTTLEYSNYLGSDAIYLSYFFTLLGILCMIYLVVTIFGLYYEKLDEKSRSEELEMED